VNLFERRSFISHSGKPLDWKIECDALSDADIETLAGVVAAKFRFYKVVGIPNGGLRLAKALEKYEDHTAGRALIVDDVLTTGRSVVVARAQYPGAYVVVIFARAQCPWWCTPIFKVDMTFENGRLA
jgi:hypothetical protein